MSLLDTTLLSKALLHSLWQGAVIAAIVFLALRVISESRTEFRYTLSLCALFLLPICFVATYSYLDFGVTREIAHTLDEVRETVSVPTMDDVQSERPIANVSFPQSVTEYTNRPTSWHSLICGLWYTGVFLMLMRLALNFRATTRFRNDGTLLSDGDPVDILRDLEQRMGLRKRTRLLIHNSLSQPAALGIFRPAILLPASALTGLDTSQLEAILAHELAHIRRYDYFFNFLQCLVEALFFFNPFVWFLGRTVRFERETCCDQLAVRTLGSTYDYGRALLHAVEVFQAQPAVLLSNLGADNSNDFRERFLRLIQPGSGRLLRLRGKSLVGLVLGTVIFVGAITSITYQTVFFTAGLLTPEERVTKLAEIEESSRPEGPVFVTISGHMYDEHGEPYTGYVSGNIRYPGMYMDCGFRVEDGYFSFTKKVSDGFTISVLTEGNAPIRLGPYLAEEDGIIDGIEIRLHKGISNTLRLVNEANEPLAGVKIWGGHQLQKGSYSGTINLVTDEKGECIVEGSTEFSIKLAIKEAVSGYQAVDKELTLSEGGVHTWTLLEGKIVTGTVESAMTGEPIPNAQIRHFYQQSSSGSLRTRSYDFERGPVLATSDALGHFHIDTIVEETTNTLFVEADGYAREVLIDIHDNSPALMVKMGVPITLSGIIDVPDHLMPDRIRISNSVQTSENSYHAESEIVDVVDGTFHFPNLYSGEWEIRRTEVILRTTLQLEESIEDFVVKGTMSVPMQIIQLNLTVPEGHPLPNGEVKITPANFNKEKNYHVSTHSSRFPVVDGKATIQVPKDSARFRISSQSGSWVTSQEPRLRGLQGYYAYDNSIKKNSSGEYPSTVSVPCRLAGSVIIDVLDESGAPFLSPFRAGIQTTTANSKGPHDRYGEYSGRINGNTITYPSLSLGEQYQFHVVVDDAYIFSPRIDLTEKEPLAKVTLHVSKPVSKEITVVDERGKPLADIPYSINYDVDGLGYSTLSSTTNEAGRAVVDNIQFSKGVETSLVVCPANIPYPRQKIPLSSFRKRIRVTLEDRAQ